MPSAAQETLDSIRQRRRRVAGNPEQLLAAADQWDLAGRGISDSADEVSATGARVGDVWQGDGGARGAQVSIAGLNSGLVELAPTAEQTSSALRGAASTLTTADSGMAWVENAYVADTRSARIASLDFWRRNSTIPGAGVYAERYYENLVTRAGNIADRRAVLIENRTSDLLAQTTVPTAPTKKPPKKQPKQPAVTTPQPNPAPTKTVPGVVSTLDEKTGVWTARSADGKKLWTATPVRGVSVGTGRAFMARWRISATPEGLEKLNKNLDENKNAWSKVQNRWNTWSGLSGATTIVTGYMSGEAATKYINHKFAVEQATLERQGRAVTEAEKLVDTRTKELERARANAEVAESKAIRDVIPDPWTRNSAAYQRLIDIRDANRRVANAEAALEAAKRTVEASRADFVKTELRVKGGGSVISPGMAAARTSLAASAAALGLVAIGAGRTGYNAYRSVADITDVQNVLRQAKDDIANSGGEANEAVFDVRLPTMEGTDRADPADAFRIATFGTGWGGSLDGPEPHPELVEPADKPELVIPGTVPDQPDEAGNPEKTNDGAGTGVK